MMWPTVMEPPFVVPAEHVWSVAIAAVGSCASVVRSQSSGVVKLSVQAVVAPGAKPHALLAGSAVTFRTCAEVTVKVPGALLTPSTSHWMPSVFGSVKLPLMSPTPLALQARFENGSAFGGVITVQLPALASTSRSQEESPLRVAPLMATTETVYLPAGTGLVASTTGLMTRPPGPVIVYSRSALRSTQIEPLVMTPATQVCGVTSGSPGVTW